MDKSDRKVALFGIKKYSILMILLSVSLMTLLPFFK